MISSISQGDNERSLGIPITYLCNRYDTNIAKSQQGFINFIVKPLFEVLQTVIPELVPYLASFEINKSKWDELIPKYEAELSKIPLPPLAFVTDLLEKKHSRTT